MECFAADLSQFSSTAVKMWLFTDLLRIAINLFMQNKFFIEFHHFMKKEQTQLKTKQLK